MLHRKLGKILLGKATPINLMASCLIGALAAFGIPFSDAPAYWVVIVVLALVLPVNLALLSLTTLVLYPLSLALMAVSFQVGQVLLDGPTSPLFAALINAPFTALMGFEYYVGTGGYLVAIVLGAVLGFLLLKLVRVIRAGFLKADTKSEAFHKWASKWWVKFVVWLLLGASPKAATYEMLQDRRVGRPIRPLGLVVAVLLVAGLVFAAHSLSGPVLTSALKNGLEQANGATVDLGNAEIRLDQGSVVIEDLALADPNALDTDLLRGFRLEADVGMGDLLARKYRVDKLVVSQASSGEKRATRGERIADEPEEVPPAGEDKTLDDYLKDAEEWRERLAQVRRWLDRFAGEPDPEEADTDEERKDRLGRIARERGYAEVIAGHLIRGAPRLSIGELRLEGLRAMQVGGQQFDVVGENLSTHPHLLDAKPRLSVRAQDGSVVFDVGLARDGGAGTIELALKGIPGDAIGEQLKFDGAKPIAGGTIDFSTRGTWRVVDGAVDLPIDVVLNDTTLAIAGSKPRKIERLELPIKLFGPLDDPRVLFRQEDLSKALIAAGERELADRVGKKLDEHVPEGAREKINEGLDSLFGGKKDKDEKKK
ncbi:MAG: hypothetical protein ABFS86_02545 [Planctomycetota bacterium]